LTLKLTRTPELYNPVLIACWPGIGNIGLLAVEAIKDAAGAEEFGYIEPWDFFYPKKVLFRDGELVGLEFPSSKFYFKKTEKTDLVIFIGEEQPVWDNKPYAEGLKAYQMANIVLDVAQKLGCRRVYTSGAAVTSIHHSMKSKIWAVPNNPSLLPEIKRYKNTILMSEVEGVNGQGTITGLNGLLLGVAAKRGIDGICVMGEIPVYLQGFPVLYPKASKSILELMSVILEIDIDMADISQFAEKTEQEINLLYDKLPQDVKSQLEDLRQQSEIKADEQHKITEEDKQKIIDDIDKFFQSKDDGDSIL
jgi:proteasome assembly chaperone (PAC2) family protein